MCVVCGCGVWVWCVGVVCGCGGGIVEWWRFDGGMMEVSGERMEVGGGRIEV